MTYRPLRAPVLGALLLSAASSACAADHAPPAFTASIRPAVRQPDAARPVEVVSVPTPLPLPGQLKPLVPFVPPARTSPEGNVVAANAAARIQPVRNGFVNAMQLYPWSEGALYQVYAAPGHVTDITLQPGETLAGAGPVAAGDTARWIIGDTVSGAGDVQRVHILAKPIRPDLVTNLVINTNRRTYHIELRATAATYMASVSWSYPQDELIALRRQNADIVAKAPIAADVNLAALNFGYSIEGDSPTWRPVRAFDDGRQAYIEFPRSIAQDEMPPVFILGENGSTELVNYRVQDRFMVLERLFSTAELRLGDRKTEKRVRVVRSVERKGHRR
jgi:P-type conjugative transfer protein TrbG